MFDQHKEYDSDVTTSKQHLAKLKQRQFTDKIITWAGFLFFLCVVLSIWYRRLFRM
jgi:hypothetical protein